MATGRIIIKTKNNILIFFFDIKSYKKAYRFLPKRIYIENMI